MHCSNRERKGSIEIEIGIAALFKNKNISEPSGECLISCGLILSRLVGSGLIWLVGVGASPQWGPHWLFANVLRGERKGGGEHQLASCWNEFYQYGWIFLCSLFEKDKPLILPNPCTSIFYNSINYEVEQCATVWWSKGGLFKIQHSCRTPPSTRQLYWARKNTLPKYFFLVVSYRD